MGTATDEFIHRRNVANYQRLLNASPDAPRRTLLLSLLAEEQTRARAHGWFSSLGLAL